MPLKALLAEVAGFYLEAPRPVFRLDEVYPQFLPIFAEHAATADMSSAAYFFATRGHLLLMVKARRCRAAQLCGLIRDNPGAFVVYLGDGSGVEISGKLLEHRACALDSSTEIIARFVDLRYYAYPPKP